MPLFEVKSRSTKQNDKNLLTKVKSKSSTTISLKGGGTLMDKIANIVAVVNSKLGKYKDRYRVIRSYEDLVAYIDKAIKVGEIGIDTETTGLNPILDQIAGVCLYVPGEKGCYVPINHISYITQQRVEDQLEEAQVAEQLQRLVDNHVFTIWFNAKFDIRFIYNQLGVKIKPDWDGYVAARMLNENEPSNGLKPLHNKYCLGGKGDAWSFDSLFHGIPFIYIPINTAYLYAARDPEITYELYKFQEPYLDIDQLEDREDLQRVAWVFHNIEMPLLPVVADMEDTGIAFDFELNAQLSEKYGALLVEKEKAFHELCDKLYGDRIEAYKKANPAHKLSTPISISSPPQIATLFYDIIGVKPVVVKSSKAHNDSGRGTGAEVLAKIDNPLVKPLLEYREVNKLMTTYIDKMRDIVNPKTGRIHASFNQNGTDTGRFSSQDPNMQNIPSHNDDVRKMFKASDGYVMMSSDYSAQEPRLTATMSADEKMIQAYCEGKDLYAAIASIAFQKPYEECLEFRPDGTKNKAGKERRSQAKAIVLGICYGKGIPAIAEDLRITKQRAQEIYDSIMGKFPGLRQFIEDSHNMAKELGYVTTFWGRKRRLPNVQLPEFEFSYVGSQNFDPLADDDEDLEVDAATQQRYARLLKRSYSKAETESVKKRARAEGVAIKDNRQLIAEAERQSVNSRIQGSAADQTKQAMILVANDQKMKDWGFRLLIPIHDELLGECPREYAKECSERLAALMVEAAKDLSVPSKCDVEITERWYGEEIEL